MLSKKAHFMLKTAKSTPEKKIGYLDFKKKTNWDYDSIKSAGNQLVERGLATEKYYSPIPGNSVLWGIVLSEEGRNSKKYFWFRIADFILKSVAVPMAVSVATTLATLWLQGLFPIK